MAAVVLVDSGGTNIGSVRYALARLGVEAELVSDAAAIRRADRVILPGVGAAPPAMQRLRAAGLVDTLRELRQPVLGICLGMQLLFDGSDEGDTDCLAVIPARIARLPETDTARVPHMGWNRLRLARPTALLDGVAVDAHAYFVHSFAAPLGGWTAASCDHAVEFSAVVNKANYHGVQFHPERSADLGARILANFMTL